MTLVTLEINQGIQNLIISKGPPNEASVPVWSKSGYWPMAQRIECRLIFEVV